MTPKTRPDYALEIVRLLSNSETPVNNGQLGDGAEPLKIAPTTDCRPATANEISLCPLNLCALFTARTTPNDKRRIL